MSALRPTRPVACDLIIANGRILDLDAEGSVIDGHDIVIDNDTIVAVTPEAAAEWAPIRRYRVPLAGPVYCAATDRPGRSPFRYMPLQGARCH